MSLWYTNLLIARKMYCTHEESIFHKIGLKWIRAVASHLFCELDILATAKAPCMRGRITLNRFVQ